MKKIRSKFWVLSLVLVAGFASGALADDIEKRVGALEGEVKTLKAVDAKTQTALEALDTKAAGFDTELKSLNTKTQALADQDKALLAADAELNAKASALSARADDQAAKHAALQDKVDKILERALGTDCSAICQVMSSMGRIMKTVPLSGHGMNGSEAFQSLITQCSALKTSIEYSHAYQLLDSQGVYASLANSCQRSQTQLR